MKKAKHWHPNTEQLKVLGFEPSRLGSKDNYKFYDAPSATYSVHWGHDLDGDAFLYLKEGSSERFYGQLENDEELLTLFRQVGWLKHLRKPEDINYHEIR